MNESLARAQVVTDIAELLDVDADSVDEDENLVDAGLDSIRIMSLVEKWSSAGTAVGFVDLAEQPTLTAWFKVLGV